LISQRRDERLHNNARSVTTASSLVEVMMEMVLVSDHLVVLMAPFVAQFLKKGDSSSLKRVHNRRGISVSSFETLFLRSYKSSGDPLFSRIQFSIVNEKSGRAQRGIARKQGNPFCSEMPRICFWLVL